MIIISQNKTEIINFDRIAEIVVSENNICITDRIEQEKGCIIAVYKTNTRAKEVLKEIIEAMSGKSEITIADVRIKTAVQNRYYEMPEE